MSQRQFRFRVKCCDLEYTFSPLSSPFLAINPPSFRLSARIYKGPVSLRASFTRSFALAAWPARCHLLFFASFLLSSLHLTPPLPFPIQCPILTIQVVPGVPGPPHSLHTNLKTSIFSLPLISTS